MENENVVVLPKNQPGQPVHNEDDLRNLAKTNFPSKVFEGIIASWILPIINQFLDPSQCDGLKNFSINYYLIKILDFIHVNLDKRSPHAVVLGTLDLSKAYNRGSHQHVIEDLHVTEVALVNLKNSLIPDPQRRPYPLNYHKN